MMVRYAIVVAALFLVTADVRGQHGAANGEWPYYGGDLGSTRYAPLDQINRDNVSELEIVWRWSGLNLGPRPDYNFRATPIMMSGVLYTTAGSRRSAVAIDPATGETLWWYRFDEGERGASAPRKTSGRGVSYWSDGDDARIFFITPSYFMIALDAETGRPYPDFGRDGVVDLKEDLDQPIDLIKDAIGSSTPGIVIGDVIVIGAALPAGGAPPTKEMPKGYTTWVPRLGQVHTARLRPRTGLGGEVGSSRQDGRQHHGRRRFWYGGHGPGDRG